MTHIPQMMLDLTPNNDNVAAIAASLSVLTNIAQGVYARYRGRKRDPMLKEIAQDVKQIKADVRILDRRVDSLEARRRHREDRE